MTAVSQIECSDQQAALACLTHAIMQDLAQLPGFQSLSAQERLDMYEGRALDFGKLGPGFGDERYFLDLSFELPTLALAVEVRCQHTVWTCRSLRAAAEQACNDAAGCRQAWPLQGHVCRQYPCADA